VEGKIRLSINYITKEEFPSLYYQAHIKAITERNIRSGFIAIGLIPYDLERILSTLNLILQTPSPTRTDLSK
jgi:hypothetical protein